MRDGYKTNYMQFHGEALFEMGFPVIPIRARSKLPSIANWQNKEATGEDLEQWSSVPECGVGIQTGRICAIDIDCPDTDIVAGVVKFCFNEFGEVPRRGGANGHELLVYRSADPGRRKQVSAKFGDPLGGSPYKVEVLGKGQQFVAYGIHPDTNEPYPWLEGDPYLCRVGAEDLPKLSETGVKGVLAEFERLAKEAGYEVTGEGKAAGDRGVTEVGALDAVKHPLDVSDEYVGLVLDALVIGDCDYDDWLEIGMALHHQYGGSDKGLGLWDAWCKDGEHYDPKGLAYKWSTFNQVRDGGPITFATLIKKAGLTKADEDEPEKDPLAETLRHCVYVREGDSVADLRQIPQYGVCKLLEFKNALANVRKEVVGETPTGRETRKMVSIAHLWLVDPLRKTAMGKDYDPSKPPVFMRSGQNTYNTFAFPRHVKTLGVDKLGVFFEHVKYLFPVEAERRWFVAWMAHIAQRPGERPPVSPLHIARPHGTGRGLLVSTLHNVFGSWNCKKTTIKELVNGDYTDYLHQSLLVFVEEAGENGVDRYEVSDGVRDKICEPVLPINTKYGFKGTAQVYSRMFMMSNHMDALRVPPQDRRLNVFEGPERLEGGAYYDRYLEWLREPEETSAQLFNWLLRQDISAWDCKRSMDTAARQRMIDYSRSVTEERFFELLSAPPAEVMTHAGVVKVLEDMLGADPMSDNGINPNQVTKLLQEQCSKYKRIKVKGVLVTPWNMLPGKQHSKEEIRRFLVPNKGKNVGITTIR